jgi:SAM-dependent methyltransferase
MKWAAKIIAKVILARLPVPYALWRSLGAFRHGRMASDEYPLKIFRLHINRAYPDGMPAGLTVLEIGPGDSIASAIIGAGYGVKQTYLVDVGDFASKDLSFYKVLAGNLRAQGLNAPEIANATSFDGILHVCSARYLTNGLASLKEIATGSIDFAFSHSVLEHVRKHELGDVLRELRRVLKAGAYASHNIDFQDHLDGRLNNLRFSEKLWESALFADSGFYTNRVPAVVMHDMFKAVGFEIEDEGFGRWPALPTPRRSMHADFGRYQDEELINRTSHVLLRPQITS